jgi:hypothetical protein
MQSQIISETKYKKTRQTQLKCSVFATSNSTKKMLDPLLSRFVGINVEKYSYEEFKEIAMKVLREMLATRTLRRPDVLMIDRFIVFDYTCFLSSHFLDYRISRLTFTTLVDNIRGN